MSYGDAIGLPPPLSGPAAARMSPRDMPTYRVLVSDPISEKGVEALAAAPDISVDVKTGLKPEELLEIIGDYHGLVVRSQTKVTAEVFAAAKNLKAVGRAGVGVDNIDRKAATDHGVVVMNTPAGNTICRLQRRLPSPTHGRDGRCGCCRG